MRPYGANDANDEAVRDDDSLKMTASPHHRPDKNLVWWDPKKTGDLGSKIIFVERRNGDRRSPPSLRSMIKRNWVIDDPPTFGVNKFGKKTSRQFIIRVSHHPKG